METQSKKKNGKKDMNRKSIHTQKTDMVPKRKTLKLFPLSEWQKL